MSKTTAPLLSFDASGQVGKSVVYSRWRGVKYARRHVIPANPRTTAQQFSRNTFALLREMWKLLGSASREPWDAFATGRAFLPVNAFIGENRRAVPMDNDLSEFIGSPGARGGIALPNMMAVAGSTAGEIDLTWSDPDMPDDWTLTAIHALAFPNQQSDARFDGPFVYNEYGTGSESETVSGLMAGTDYVVSMWTEMTKPDGRTAYGPSLVTTATSGA